MFKLDFMKENIGKEMKALPVKDMGSHLDSTYFFFYGKPYRVSNDCIMFRGCVIPHYYIQSHNPMGT